MIYDLFHPCRGGVAKMGLPCMIPVDGGSFSGIERFSVQRPISLAHAQGELGRRGIDTSRNSFVTFKFIG